MKLLTLITVLFLSFSVKAQEKAAGPPPLEIKTTQIEPVKIPEYLQNVSVMVAAPDGTGSGVLFTRKDNQGNIVNYCLSAAHVVEKMRTEREVITEGGGKKTIVEFGDPSIIRHIIEGGRMIGKLEIESEVIKYSDEKHGEDLVITRLRQKNFSMETAFFLPENIIPVGADILHVGSRKGELGAGNFTAGVLSQVGKVLDNKRLFDVSSAPGTLGSSGGGTFLKSNGAFIGTVQRTAGETFMFIKPVRVIKQWAKEQKVDWIFDPNLPMPSDEEVKKIPIEDKK